MAYRDHYRLEPLHIRALLRTPIVADQYLPLDGILLYQAHREKAGFQAITLSGEYVQQTISTLPLDIVHPGRRQWYYRCSWAQWPDHTREGRDYWNKRFDSSLADLVDFQGQRGKVIVEQGEYKAYHMPVYYRAALWVEWYAVGDRQEINQLLQTVTHIGKKTVQGWGRVYQWQISPFSDDYSVWYGNRLMRGIPANEAPGFSSGVYGIRPSYWNKANQMMLALP